MVKFWKDTFRTGQVGQVQDGAPNKDTAANFAAQVTVAGRPFTDILTASSNTCPTFDAETGTFTDWRVRHERRPSGVLTDPGILAQYFANMAFRRVRFIQETFACSKHPTEFSATPVAMGNGTYTGPYDFKSITGKVTVPAARIDFQDTSAVICANCHVTLNHAAPLFTKYDENGVLQQTEQVKVPIPGEPAAKLTDYLAAGEPLAWRMGKNATDIPSFGQQMATDPDVARCAVNRMWNYAMSRGDIVNDPRHGAEHRHRPVRAGLHGERHEAQRDHSRHLQGRRLREVLSREGRKKTMKRIALALIGVAALALSACDGTSDTLTDGRDGVGNQSSNSGSTAGGEGSTFNHSNNPGGADPAAVEQPAEPAQIKNGGLARGHVAPARLRQALERVDREPDHFARTHWRSAAGHAKRAADLQRGRRCARRRELQRPRARRRRSLDVRDGEALRHLRDGPRMPPSATTSARPPAPT